MKSIRTKIMLAMALFSAASLLIFSVIAFIIANNALTAEVEEKLVRQSINEGSLIEKQSLTIEAIAIAMAMAESASMLVNVDNLNTNNSDEISYVRELQPILDEFVISHARFSPI